MIIVDPVSPVAFSLFGFGVRWYALAYIAAFVVGFWLFRRLDQQSEIQNQKYYDDLFTFVILGVVIGGRLGYVLFYNLSYFLQNPLEIFAIWQGGMSFHGGLLGVIFAVLLFSYRECAKRKVQSANDKQKVNCTLHFALCALDIMAVVAPIGLFFGRIANFINMEVMGRPTMQPWGVVFNGTGDIVPRHPSPLYEAATEGVLLFIIMFCLLRFTKLRQRVGALSGAFAMLYAIFRIFCEQFRAPDVQIGFLTDWGLTMGGLLSAAMFIAGAVLFIVAMRRS